MDSAVFLRTSRKVKKVKTKEQSYALIKKSIMDRIDSLERDAEDIVKAHWKSVKEVNDLQGDNWKNKSILSVRSLRTGNNFRLEWFTLKWIGKATKGTRKTIPTPILKPAGKFAYTLSKLYSECRPWEIDFVKETETKLTVIRQEMRHINKALQMIRFAETANAVPLDVEDEKDEKDVA